jgi:hypothetical protein
VTKDPFFHNNADYDGDDDLKDSWHGKSLNLRAMFALKGFMHY